MRLVSLQTASPGATLSLRRLAESFFTYRLHLYLLSFLLVLSSFAMFRRGFPLRQVAISLCFASLMAFIYLSNKVTDLPEDSVNLRGGPITGTLARPLLAIALLLFAAPVLYLIQYRDFLLLYLGVALLGFLYSYGVTLGGHRFRLKNILGIKTIAAALGWSLPAAGVYAISLGRVTETALFLFYLVFCITATTELIWDIRDMAGDKKYGVHTLPNTLGLTATKAVGAVLIGSVLALGCLTHLNRFSMTGLCFSLAFMLCANPRRGAWYYHAIVVVWIVALIGVLTLA